MNSDDKIQWQIAKLEQEIRDLRDQLRWRKWPEEKPDKGGAYLVYETELYKDPCMHVGYFVPENNERWLVNHYQRNITHWRPLGEDPSGNVMGGGR